MNYAVLKLQALRDRCRMILPKRWVVPPRSHTEGLYPRRASGTEMEIQRDSPASSWVAWEISSRQRRGGRRSSPDRTKSE
jgi:hypothetical protein